MNEILSLAAAAAHGSRTTIIDGSIGVRQSAQRKPEAGAAVEAEAEAEADEIEPSPSRRDANKQTAAADAAR